VEWRRARHAGALAGPATQSHSRPHISNDDPFSESQFKTMKYCPDLAGDFASIEAARQHA
jgi:putative transposase